MKDDEICKDFFGGDIYFFFMNVLNCLLVFIMKYGWFCKVSSNLFIFIVYWIVF